MAKHVQTRDREQTRKLLIEAVGRVLAQDGFAGLGVNAVARAAGVDKVLIYRYFDGLPNLLQAYGESGDFWPSLEEVLGPDENALRKLPLDARTAIIVANLLDALRKRPQTIEILAWEAVQQNALTGALADVREQWSRNVIARVLPDSLKTETDVLALASLLVAGFQYLLIRSRNTKLYGGLALQTDDGWRRIRNALFQAFRLSPPPRSRH
ncbi:MAG TPA: TetR/AcrR family transcriptional regulator [Burkholderiales bacterium]|nr:TetR/AcrR family transcriptional regulator [Burkholderiales bacterium]